MIDMKSVYRVHSTIIYLEGHPLREKAIRDAGVYWKEREVVATKWDIVIAEDCQEAISLILIHYAEPLVEVKRVYSINHIGDITVC